MASPGTFRTPGQLIRSLLEERGWSKRTLAVVLGVSEPTVTRITSDKYAVDARLSIMLEELFGVPADRFLSLQMELDLAQARLVTQPDPDRATRAFLFGDLPLSEMITRGWIDAEGMRDTAKVERELIRFFGVNRLEDIEILPHAAKKTAVNSELTAAQLAWLYRVRAITADMPVRPFSHERLKAALPKLKALMIAPEEARQASRALLECGIRFVIVETLSSAKIDGVCFWLDDASPVIGVSLRYDRIDNFWFVLRHEIEHVLQGHGKAAAIFDIELEGQRAGTGSSIAEEERIANKAAADFCVPTAQMDAFIARKAPLFSERDLRGFAKILNVHPGIVAGQLQHRTERYQIFRTHLVRIRNFVTSSAMVDGWGTVSPVGA